MDGLLTQTGVAGILIVLVLREVFAFVRTRNAEPEPTRVTLLARIEFLTTTLEGMRRQLNELHAWHDQRDADGVPVWYVRTSLELAITGQTAAMKTLADNIAAQSRLLERLVEKIDASS